MRFAKRYKTYSQSRSIRLCRLNERLVNLKKMREKEKFGSPLEHVLPQI